MCCYQWIKRALLAQLWQCGFEKLGGLVKGTDDRHFAADRLAVQVQVARMLKLAWVFQTGRAMQSQMLLIFQQLGVSQNLRSLLGGPHNKDYSIFGSTLGYAYLGKLPPDSGCTFFLMQTHPKCLVSQTCGVSFLHTDDVDKNLNILSLSPKP